MPLPVPEKRFKHFMVNFVTGLSSFINAHRKVCTNVMIIVNHFSKYVTFMSIWKINAVSVNCTWFTEFYWENGVSNFIVSDYGPQFVSDFWKQICFCINIDIKLSTVFYSKTND